ncbi:MAG: OsmC family peroxiredoxin, partial [Bacteroidetes bacterium]|nr:OsmC family peroxiredoxin [Bacteroidota bacterium]
MKISASIKNEFNQHTVVVKTNDAAKEITIAPKSTGYGSSVNGAELLMLSLATCFC